MSPFQPTLTVEQIRDELVKKIAEMIRRARVSRYEHRSGASDRWYWAAPILIDRADSKVKPNLSWWLHDIESLRVRPSFPLDPKRK